MSAQRLYPGVNWINGMKIKKDHFIQQDNAFEERVRDAAGCFLTSFNYGLLPVSQADETSFRIEARVTNGRYLNLKLFRIRALTQAGARIEFPQGMNSADFSFDLTNEAETAGKEEESQYYIVLSINMFVKEPYGDLNPEEDPPRHPNVRPSMKINIIPKKQIASDEHLPYSLIIGRITILPDRIEITEGYIPACMSVRSHISLMNFHSSLVKFYDQLENHLLGIVRKIREKSQDSGLASSVLNLSLNLIDFISLNSLKVRWQFSDQPPITMFENIACLARVMRNTIECNTSANKEELLNYFTSWSELKQGDFEKMLVRCINFQYSHPEIADQIDQFAEFLRIISSLFAKLESLAYIGKKKETNIFVKEQTSKRSFLVD